MVKTNNSFFLVSYIIWNREGSSNDLIWATFYKMLGFPETSASIAC